MHFKGMLFDLDGTLINSLDAVEATWGEWADRQGLDRATVQHYVHGKPALSVLRHFMTEASSETIAKEFSQLETYESSHTNGITPVPGAVEFLPHLNQISAPWAVATSGSLKVTAARIRQAGLISARQNGCVVVEVGTPQSVICDHHSLQSFIRTAKKR